MVDHSVSPVPGDLQEVQRAIERQLSSVDDVCRELDELAAVGEAGGGLVTALIQGSGRVLELAIDPDFHEEYDAESVAALVLAAIDDGHERLARLVRERTS
ncbi:MAG: YbaB/EbfC family nucleoid-associated protein [Nocardioides sp.]